MHLQPNEYNMQISKYCSLRVFIWSQQLFKLIKKLLFHQRAVRMQGIWGEPLTYLKDYNTMKNSLELAWKLLFFVTAEG